jgi:hypothetical protein
VIWAFCLKRDRTIRHFARSEARLRTRVWRGHRREHLFVYAIYLAGSFGLFSPALATKIFEPEWSSWE